MQAPQESSTKNDESISVIYHRKNESPKFFRLKKSQIVFYLITIPCVILLSLGIGAIGLIQLSPTKFITNYKNETYKIQVENILEENTELKNQILALKEEINEQKLASQSQDNESPDLSTNEKTDKKEDAVEVTSPLPNSGVKTIGLSTLSHFKPIQGQKDLTRPAQISLSGFKVSVERDTLMYKFNIIPTSTNDSKISGYIVVLLKNDLGVSVYPLDAMRSADHQISYSAGESFSTQRFRPVEASFLKPKKSGNMTFTVFIFSRTGDLIHYQTNNMLVTL